MLIAFQEVVAGIVNHNRPRRAQNRFRKIAESSEPSRDHMRLTEDQVCMVAEDFDASRLHVHPKSSLHASTRRIEMSYIASGGYCRQLAITFATSTASDYVHEVADFLYETASQHIKFPRPELFGELSLPLQDPNGQNLQVILYIDGEIVKIQRPDHAGDAYYCGRPGKHCDSVNIQYVVDKRVVIRYVVSGLSGATHDRTFIEWSREFMDFLDTLPEDVVVLGDPAYRNLHPRIVATVGGRNLAPEEIRYNDACTRIRQVVERSIGATKLKWWMSQMKENRFPAKKGRLFAAKCMVAICQLHNRFTNYI
ncbi:hypothetical protein LOTGIDRAFT_160901 [Lottia gigantea]|uniref:DDE Tnp4 domain-containing protein n=1 Tax=Lottia gigantea TaxID=225164 RepID=V3ZUH6_LOTGI|nr:hypothetical protein LOTGIDRAFT_160901 [Lottia gigantea]ESO95138.1 hypothetical protein LOTGIDRAFT_160901 [Lottia gigantea]